MVVATCVDRKLQSLQIDSKVRMQEVAGLYAVPVCDRYSIPLCMVFLDGGLLSGSVCDEGTPCIQLPMP